MKGQIKIKLKKNKLKSSSIVLLARAIEYRHTPEKKQVLKKLEHLDLIKVPNFKTKKEKIKEK